LEALYQWHYDACVASSSFGVSLCELIVRRAVGVPKCRSTGSANAQGGEPVKGFLQQLWSDERGQDIAEYAVMLAVILVIVVGTIRLIGSNANNVFSEVGSAIQ
jgi:Flp pilus assembly pilin Flp